MGEKTKEEYQIFGEKNLLIKHVTSGIYMLQILMRVYNGAKRRYVADKTV